MSFSADLIEFAEKTDRGIEETRQAVVTELFNSVIQDTPVDTGRARGNWQASLNTPKSGELERVSGEAAKAEVAANLGKGDVTNYLTNNLPYAQALEEGSSKKQAPAGMVRKNVARLQRILKKAINKSR